MSIKFVPLKVAEIIRETHDANTVVFEKPADGSFDYQPGQYLTLRFDLAGEDVRRAYSLCSSPITDAKLAVTVKRVDQGKVSNHIGDNLKAGDTVQVMPPMGNFKVDLNAANKHHYVLIGGGSGITPLMSIIKSVLKVETESEVTLIYANRDADSIIFKSELEAYEAKEAGRFRVIHSLDTAPAGFQGLTGQMNRQGFLSVLNDLMNVDQLPKTFWLCGPRGMMEEAEAAMGFLGIQKGSIKKESFTAKVAEPKEETAAAPVGPGKAGDYTIRVILDGEEKDVFVKKSNTILEAVVDAGMDPPFACQMGVCCTCRAQVTAGKVEMEEDEGLSDSEIEEGYILTCQSHPMTEGVVLEYK